MPVRLSRPLDGAGTRHANTCHTHRRMLWFWRHGARTYPAPTRRLLEALTDQPACVISSHSSLLKAMVAARAAPRCFSFLRERRSRRTCSSCSLGSLGSFMVSSSKAKSSRWVRAFSRLARRGFAFSGWGCGTRSDHTPSIIDEITWFFRSYPARAGC